MNLVLRLGGPVVLAVLAMPTAASADVAWSNPSGSTSLFSWDSGYSNLGLFGDPTISGNSFIFAPPAFTAVNPGTPTRSDTIQVVITVQPGQTITGVAVHEIGTRTSTNRTTVQGTLRVKDLTVGGINELTNSMVYGNDTGTPINWTGDASIGSLTFLGGTSFQLTLTNNLSALLSGQSITKTGVVIEILPTPGAATALLGMAGCVVLRRRRRV